jgi:hypothetical protein
MRVIATVAVAAAAAVAMAGLTTAPSMAAQTAATETPLQVAVAFQPSAVKYKFKNCTALNKVYAHGVGKSGAKDKTSGKAVTDFVHSTSLYKKVIKYRKGLDRDKDGIACEKA